MSWKQRPRTLTVLLLGVLVFAVAKLIGEGVAQPGAFCFLLAILQLTLFCLVILNRNRVSLRLLFVVVFALCMAWGIAVPGIGKSMRTARLLQSLSTGPNAVDLAPSMGAIGNWLPVNLRKPICLRCPVSVYLREVSQEEITQHARRLSQYGFAGRLDVEADSCGDECLQSISEIRSLRELSVCAVKGPTNAGISHLLGKLDLESLSLKVRCSSSSPLPFSLTSRFLTDAYASQGVSWKVDDRGLANIGRTANISIHGLPVDGSFLQSHSAPDRVSSLSFRSTLVGEKGIAWLGNLSNITQLKIGGSPIGNEVFVDVGSLPRLKYLWLNSTLIDDDGIQSLLKLRRSQFSFLWINADSSSFMAKSVRDHFSSASAIRSITVNSQGHQPEVQ